MKKNTLVPLLISAVAIFMSAVLICLALLSDKKTQYYLNATEKAAESTQKNIELKAVASDILKNRKAQYETAVIKKEQAGTFEKYKTQPTVFLTFDDGPNESALKIAEYLHSQGLSATFFSVCANLQSERNVEILKKITDMGFTVGLHGYYHEMKIYNGYEAFMQDLQSAQTILKEKGIPQARLLRFPWTSGSAKEALYKSTGNNKAYDKIREILSQIGYSVVDFDISGNDWGGGATTESIIADTLESSDYVLEKTYKAGVLLLHCTPASAEAIPAVINGLIEKGFSFDTLEENDFPYNLFGE